MKPVKLKIVKELVNFTNEKNGESVKLGGIRVVLGPKVEKFIMLVDENTGRKSNLELLEYTNPDLCQWFTNVSYGSEAILSESLEPSTIQGIYSQQSTENML